MLWLPPIQHAGRLWHLPLSERAATYLLVRTLSERGEEISNWSNSRLRKLLLSDPAFTLWCLWHQQSSRPVDGALTFKSLAKWVVRVPVTLWSQPAVALSNDIVAKSMQPRRCRQRAHQAICAVLDATGERWALKSTALAQQLRDADRWFAAPRGKLSKLPIPEVVRRQIGKLRRPAASPDQTRNLRRKYRRLLRRTWSNPEISHRKILGALCSPARTSSAPLVSADDEKLQAIRELAYGASHEINNPLANIATRAQTLLRLTEDPVWLKHFSAINQQAFRAHEMIADLMLFAKPPKLQLSIFDLAELVHEVTQQALDELTTVERDISICEELTPILVQADPVQMAVAVKAILRNAVESVQGRGSIRIRLKRVPSTSTSGSASLFIRDNGPGLSEEACQHLFDPFFSGRESGRGLGFGLTKAWTIMQLHQGHISARLPSAGGVEFIIKLPCN